MKAILTALSSSLVLGACTLGAQMPFGQSAGYSTSGGSYARGGYASGGGGYQQGGGGYESGEAPPDSAQISGSPRCIHDRAGAEFRTAGSLAVGVNGGCVEGQDVDVYAITATDNPGGTLYSFRMVADQQICATMFNGDRQQLGGGDCVTDNKTGTWWASVAPGTTIFVKLDRTFDRASPYTLEVKQVEISDDEEPNNNWKNAVALSLGKPHEALMQMAVNDKKLGADFYKVEVDDSGTLDVTVDPQSDDIEAEVFIFDQDRKQVARESAENEGAVLRFSEKVAPGTYYVVIGENSSIVAPWGISGNGTDKPTSHYFTPYKLTVDMDDARPSKRGGKRSRVSRR